MKIRIPPSRANCNSLFERKRFFFNAFAPVSKGRRRRDSVRGSTRNSPRIARHALKERSTRPKARPRAQCRPGPDRPSTAFHARLARAVQPRPSAHTAPSRPRPAGRSPRLGGAPFARVRPRLGAQEPPPAKGTRSKVPIPRRAARRPPPGLLQKIRTPLHAPPKGCTFGLAANERARREN